MHASCHVEGSLRVESLASYIRRPGAASVSKIPSACYTRTVPRLLAGCKCMAHAPVTRAQRNDGGADAIHAAHQSVQRRPSAAQRYVGTQRTALIQTINAAVSAKARPA